MATSVHALISKSLRYLCHVRTLILFCRLILMYSGLTLTIRVNHCAAIFCTSTIDQRGSIFDANIPHSFCNAKYAQT